MEKNKNNFSTLEKLSWQDIVDFLPDAAFVIDQDKKVVGWNHGMEDLTGVSRDSILGNGDYCYSIPFYGNRRPIMIDLVKVPDEEIEKNYDYVKREGNTLSAEVYLPTVFGGRGAFLWAKAWAIYDKNKNFIASLELIRDISEHKRSEAILKQDKEYFEQMVAQMTKKLVETEHQLVESKHLSELGALSAIVGHELRNPLGVISMAAFNIKKKLSNDNCFSLVEKNIDNIEKKVIEADRIINNLLFYSKIRKPKIESFNIYDLILECIQEVKLRFSSDDIKFIVDIKKIKDLFIEADSLQIKEVFINILSNAFEAIISKSGAVELKAIKDSNKNEISVSIKDNGLGIDDMVQANVFTPFFSTKPKGTGLGLAVSKQIVNFHRGRIVFESVKNQGTSFTIVLPIKSPLQ